jgi:hypothetical protein
MSYIDTSVVVASLDPRRELVLGVLEKLGDKRVSELVLAELSGLSALCVFGNVFRRGVLE